MKLLKKILKDFRERKMIKNNRRSRLRKNASFPVACWIKFKEPTSKSLLAGEVLTTINNISERGASLNWPRDWNCQLCPYRVDLPSNSLCELEDCVLKSKDINTGSVMELSIQIGGKIYRSIKARVVWHKESEDSSNRFNKIGLRFDESVKFEIA